MTKGLLFNPLDSRQSRKPLYVNMKLNVEQFTSCCSARIVTYARGDCIGTVGSVFNSNRNHAYKLAKPQKGARITECPRIAVQALPIDHIYGLLSASLPTYAFTISDKDHTYSGVTLRTLADSAVANRSTQVPTVFFMEWLAKQDFVKASDRMRGKRAHGTGKAVLRSYVVDPAARLIFLEKIRNEVTQHYNVLYDLMKKDKDLKKFCKAISTNQKPKKTSAYARW